MCDEQAEYEEKIRKDINFILRDYPLKKISKEDLIKIKGLEISRISCFSHRQLGTVKGLHLYCHNERKKIREDLINFLEEHLDRVLKAKKIQVVKEGYNKIKNSSKEKNKTSEPVVSQILICGDFSKRETEKIIKAHVRALDILNNKTKLKGGQKK